MSSGTPNLDGDELTRTLLETGEQDRGAFSRLYALTSAKLFGICLRICGERQTAEDVLHDVYVTIWKKAAAYDPARGAPLPWLAAIARNRAIDRRRQWARQSARSIDVVPEPVDAAPLASETMLVDEELRRLRACMEGLTPEQRDAIRTAFFDGVTYAELADRRGVPEGTAKSWIRRGLLRLRACLDADG